MLAFRERDGAMRAQHRVAQMEHVLPFVAEEHRRLQLGLQAVIARTLCDAHALESHHAGALPARLRGASRTSPELPTVAREQCRAVAHLRHAALEPVAASHEIRGEKRLWIVVHFLRRALLLDHTVVEEEYS